MHALKVCLNIAEDFICTFRQAKCLTTWNLCHTVFLGVHCKADNIGILLFDRLQLIVDSLNKFRLTLNHLRQLFKCLYHAWQRLMVLHVALHGAFVLDETLQWVQDVVQVLIHLVKRLFFRVFIVDVSNMVHDVIVEVLLLQLEVFNDVEVLHFIGVALMLLWLLSAIVALLDVFLIVGFISLLCFKLVEVRMQIGNFDRVDLEVFNIAFTVARGHS